MCSSKVNGYTTAARTDPDSTGSRGVSMFLVPRDAPGIAMTQIPKVGNKCMPSWEIGLDGVQVGAEALMGDAAELGFGGEGEWLLRQ